MTSVFENSERSKWEERIKDLTILGESFVEVPNSYKGKFVVSPVWLDNEIALEAVSRKILDNEKYEECVNQFSHIYMILKDANGNIKIRGFLKDRYIVELQKAVQFYKNERDLLFKQYIKKEDMD